MQKPTFKWVVHLRSKDDFKRVEVRAVDNYHARRDAEIMNSGFKAEGCIKHPIQ